MRIISMVIWAACLSSCSLFVAESNAGHKSSSRKPASRRADHGKYIIEKANGAGSRNLFTQPGGKNCLNSSKAVSQYVMSNLTQRNEDQYLFILVDKNNEVINMIELDEQSQEIPLTFSDRIVQAAHDHQATSVILVQNQPTRSSNLYQHDRELSRELQLALAPIGVDLLDHLIISKRKCFSFADNRLL